MPQGSDTVEQTKQMLPVWQISGALFPSIYEASGINALTNSSYTAAFRSARMKATVAMSIEASKLAAAANKVKAKGRIPVFPFAWECYHNGSTFLTPEDLKIDMVDPCVTTIIFYLASYLLGHSLCSPTYLVLLFWATGTTPGRMGLSSGGACGSRGARLILIANMMTEDALPHISITYGCKRGH